MNPHARTHTHMKQNFKNKPKSPLHLITTDPVAFKALKKFSSYLGYLLVGSRVRTIDVLIVWFTNGLKTEFDEDWHATAETKGIIKALPSQNCAYKATKN